jgi:hypothetical protein
MAVRATAVQAVGVLGGAPEVAVLTKSLAAADPEKSAARRGLAVVRGAEATALIAATAKQGDADLRSALIDILADRRAVAALPDLAAAAVADDATVRTAAMRAIGKFGGPDQVVGMVQGVLKATAGGERDDAERALVTVCTQNPRHEQSATIFLEQFTSANDETRETLLPALGRVGGAGAIAIVDGLIADTNTAKRKFGMNALTKWPDATVSDRLLDLLGKVQDPDERELLLGALIRIAPLPDNKLNNQQKLELLQKTMTLCGVATGLRVRCIRHRTSDHSSSSPSEPGGFARESMRAFERVSIDIAASASAAAAAATSADAASAASAAAAASAASAASASAFVFACATASAAATATAASTTTNSASKDLVAGDLMSGDMVAGDFASGVHVQSRTPPTRLGVHVAASPV